ncbi:MAG: MFS transporter [Methanomassiliicoccales archaeon]|jgi:sugar phosphate permease|nr:MFS transporter [Methanomassiliicoccales archaeon]
MISVENDDIIRLSSRRAATIALTLFLATLVGYIARANVSVALPFVADEYGWGSEQLGELGGVLLGIFLVGYGISNIFISPLIDYFGPKKSLIFAVLAWSALTVLTGFFGTFVMIFILARFFLGLSQGPLFPSASKVVGTWFPPSGRARVNALYLSSGFLSNLLVPLLLLPLIVATSWQFMFYAVGAAGFILLIPLWRCLCDHPHEARSRPESRISMRSLIELTRQNLSESVRIKGLFIITFSFLSINLAWWGLSLWLPTYFLVAKGFSVEELVWGASLPYIGGLCGMYTGSWISDRTGRRVETAFIFAVIDAIFLLLLIVVFPHDHVVLVASAIFFFLGVMAPTSFTLLQSITPARLIGSATGIMNGIANGGAVFGPVLLGMAVAFTSSYDIGLIIMAIFQVIGALLLVLFLRKTREKSI